MFNNFLGGVSSGGGSGGGGDALPTSVNGLTFDDVEATSNFANQLGPPPAEVITQKQGDAPTVGNIPCYPAPSSPLPLSPPLQAVAVAAVISIGLRMNPSTFYRARTDAQPSPPPLLPPLPPPPTTMTSTASTPRGTFCRAAAYAAIFSSTIQPTNQPTNFALCATDFFSHGRTNFRHITFL